MEKGTHTPQMFSASQSRPLTCVWMRPSEVNQPLAVTTRPQMPDLIQRTPHGSKELPSLLTHSTVSGKMTVLWATTGGGVSFHSSRSLIHQERSSPSPSGGTAEMARGRSYWSLPNWETQTETSRTKKCQSQNHEWYYASPWMQPGPELVASPRLLI